MARLVAVCVAVLSLLGIAVAQVQAGSTSTCSGFTGNFAGDQMGDSVRYGAQADFPSSSAAYFGLCTGSGSGFSSTWVALQGVNAYDIFQVGLDRCRAGGCPYSEDGKIHIFWA